MFAAVHAYWVAGGPAGMNGDPATTAGEHAYIAFVALLGVAGAGVLFSMLSRRSVEGVVPRAPGDRRSDDHAQRANCLRA